MRIQIQIVRERTCCEDRARTKAERHRKHKDCLGAVHWAYEGKYGVRALYPPNKKLLYRTVDLAEGELILPRRPRPF